MTQLSRKIFAKTNDNPFYNAYCGNGNCDLHTRCPIRNNFEFLTNEKIQDFLVQKIIETSIKHKLVITSRDVLNFIYDAVVPHEFDEKAFWKTFNYPSKFLENYIKYTTPMLVFDNKGTSSLLDNMAELKVDNGNAEKRDSELLDFYASDEVAANIAAKLDDSCYKQVIVGCDLPSMEISVDSLSKGEKQIFVMSLYWAMMRQSKCQLPFIIDTPFARIDREHRSNIVDYFFKRLPGQLLILSTNEEINAKHMQTMSDSISNSFMLEFGEDKRTRVVENRYFEV